MRRLPIIVMFAALVVFVGDARSKPSTGSVRGTVTVNAKGKAKGDKKGVVVYLEGVPGTPAKGKNAVIRQREKQFEPPLTIVVKGTTIDFPNED